LSLTYISTFQPWRSPTHSLKNVMSFAKRVSLVVSSAYFPASRLCLPPFSVPTTRSPRSVAIVS